MNYSFKEVIHNEQADDYLLFKDFCILRDKGLRKDAFKTLDLFIEEAKKWDTKKQKDFACWLFGLFEALSETQNILTYPLEENLLKPILEKWIMSDPKDPRPYRWFGLFLNTYERKKHLNLSIQAGGTKEQQSLLKLIEILFDSLWFSFHHISEDLYLGDIMEDRLLINEIEDLKNKIENEQEVQYINNQLLYYKNLINDWIQFNEEETSGFVDWCKRNGKGYKWIESWI
ncbi:hypothetical protein LC087_16460 [Bacillus carboniphilus]|uniref:Uncharacterized protein n=1 Tax=Bacillus carboniphilus TaxID=86663 RepID=A0ABY9JSB1_9BACI|nr:hypothetical protein [Bacillus carboniphilus]WLR42294.1 hypothetical protein LC087_16460 [Bacillus carboniphilus]